MTRTSLTHISHSALDTETLGERIASTLEGGDIIALSGELGAGKTTLVKGIARGLGVKQKIVSPTFTLMNVYPVQIPDIRHQTSDIRPTISPTSLSSSGQADIRHLVHIDTYRLKNEDGLAVIGVEDYLGQPESICVIEWPEKITGLLKNKKRKKVILVHENATTRRIVVSA